MIYPIGPSRWLVAVLLMVGGLQQTDCFSQTRREELYSDVVLYRRRVALEKDLRERIIGRHFSLPLDSDTEDGYMSGCWAVSQFLFDTPEVEKGFRTLFMGYDSLSYDTKRALLEAVYAVAPARYTASMRSVLESETDPRLFSLCAVYLYRDEPTTENGNSLKIRMVEKFPGYDTVAVLGELENYLSYHAAYIRERMPDIKELFRYQRITGQKVIYSFQRWDRDYPGLAIVQNGDGSFVRDEQGRLQVFEQLARSGPDLPYFITNGSTPQGIYSIQGTDVSGTPFIGPTPNLQLLLPFEGTWERYFQRAMVGGAGTQGGDPRKEGIGRQGGAGRQRGGAANGNGSGAEGKGASENGSETGAHGKEEGAGERGAGAEAEGASANENGVGADGNGLRMQERDTKVFRMQGATNGEKDSLSMYMELLPPGWRRYRPMMEAWSAGRVGRTAIIAHGTTIDPEYYRNKPFYPLTPSMGCLCAKELWNPTSGHPLVSEQNNLVNAFLSTPGKKGYLFVINVDDQRKPVTRREIEEMIGSRNK